MAAPVGVEPTTSGFSDQHSDHTWVTGPYLWWEVMELHHPSFRNCFTDSPATTYSITSHYGPRGKSRTYISRLSVVHSTVELHPELWLRRKGSNLRICGSRPHGLPLADSSIFGCCNVNRTRLIEVWTPLCPRLYSNVWYLERDLNSQCLTTLVSKTSTYTSSAIEAFTESFNGVLKMSWTSNLWFRRSLLYPVELWGRIGHPSRIWTGAWQDENLLT